MSHGITKEDFSNHAYLAGVTAGEAYSAEPTGDMMERMSKPLYFAPEAIECHPLDMHREMIAGTGESVTLYRARPVPLSEVYWCSAYDEVGEHGDGMCGANCGDYSPRNGKNGRCRFHKHCYEPDLNDSITITDEP